MTREELIEQESLMYAKQFDWAEDSSPQTDYKAGINSQLAKDLTELAVIEGKIEVYKSLNTHHHHEIYQLKNQRTELLTKLNLEG